MKQIIKVDSDGVYIEPVIIEDEDETPSDCIETPCPDGFYKPKWSGSEWVEGLTQSEIDVIKASEPTNIRAEAVAEMESATTVASLKAAMLKFVNASS